MDPHLGFRVAYRGSEFQGFQSQAHSKSAQQWIERALSIFFRRPVRIQFSSRTDTGVHAWDQIVIIPHGFASFDSLTDSEKRRCLHSINALLQGKACVWEILKLSSDFQPKKHIGWKEYQYVILHGQACDPQRLNSSWWIRSPLNLVVMKKALRQFEGRHDFTSFATKRRNEMKEGSRERKILKVSMRVKEHESMKGLQLVSISVRGEGFLYRMVRNMVGALVEIGRGEKIDISHLLRQRQRPTDLVSAPAEGLTLARSFIPRRFLLKGVFILSFLTSLLSRDLVAESFDGSLSFAVSQRFFNDEKLGHINGFSEWGALQFDFTAGVYEFFRIEPIIGFSYIKNTASLYALDDAGNYVLDAQGRRIESTVDKLEYQFFTGSYGLRYKAWDQDFFLLIPFVELQQTVRYGRVRKVTYAVDQQTLNTGLDLGLEFGGGLMISFLYDLQIRNDMKMEWGAKDFGLMSIIRYQPSGFYRTGLGLVGDTGGWDFGLGLALDW